MGKCPKCNHRLSPLDWRQNCPHCGVNLMFCGFEERFYEDAKYAEMGFAKIRVKWARIKAALIGGKIQIARLCLSLLPLLVLAVPYGGAELATKQFSKTVTFGLYGLYKAFADGTLTMLAAIKGTPSLAEVSGSLLNVFIAFAAAGMFALLVLAFSLLCFLGAKVMARLVCAASALGFAASLALIFIENSFLTAVKALVFTSSASSSALVLIASALSFAIVFAVNLGIARKGIPVEYKEGDLFRVETAKKLKKGEITLADISQPVYETEDERVAREKAIQEILDEQKRPAAQAETEVTADE